MKRKNTSLSVKLDDSAVQALSEKAITALWKAAESLHTDLVDSETMPRDTGTMQNDSTYVDAVADAVNNSIGLHTETPYARRCYFHPELHFQTKKNRHPQAYWLDTYIKGDKKDFLAERFKIFYRKG